MAEEDVYGSKSKFERRMGALESWLEPPHQSVGVRPQEYRRKHWVKNPGNLACFHRFAEVMDARDLSYIRRNRYLDVLLFLFSHTEELLEDCSQHDVDAIVAAGHRSHRTRNSKETFLRMLDIILKELAPGRFKIEKRIDRSLQEDTPRVTFEELCRLVRYLDRDLLFRAFVTTMLETFARPQELAWRTLKDVEVGKRDGRAVFAKLRVSSHGKKGTKTLVIKDTLVYFLAWLDHHPDRNNPDAFLFPSMADMRSMLSPVNVTAKLKRLQKRLNIKGRLCAYELKSRGITFSCLRHDPPKLIQARAGWANMDPLVHYDKTTADQLLDADLARAGLLEVDQVVDPDLRSRACGCGAIVGFGEERCPVCRCDVGRTPRCTVDVDPAPKSSGDAGVSAGSDEELLSAMSRLLKDPAMKKQISKLLAG